MLKERGINVLLDVDIPPGVDLIRWIKEAIERSDATVFLRSDRSFSTTFVGYELGYALSLGTRVIVFTLAELPRDDPFELAGLQLIRVKPGYPEDTAPYLAQRIIESLSGDSKHAPGPDQSSGVSMAVSLLSTEVVVFVPGMMGTELFSGSGERLWPPTPFETQFGYGRAGKLLGDDVRHGKIIKNVVCFDIYGSLLSQFAELGYQENGAQKRLYLFPYDWRLD